MTPVRLISTAALSLLLGTAPLAYAQQDQQGEKQKQEQQGDKHDKAGRQDKQAKPEQAKPEQAKPEQAKPPQRQAGPNKHQQDQGKQQQQRAQQQQQDQGKQQQQRAQQQQQDQGKQQQQRAQQQQQDQNKQPQQPRRGGQVAATAGVRLSQQRQQQLVVQQQQRLTQYRQDLDRQQRVLQQQTAQLQQQKRSAQYRFQQDYLAGLHRQQLFLNDHHPDYDHDPFFFTVSIYRYNRGGRYYETNQYGADLLRQAVNVGYQEGFRAGEADRQDHWRFSYQDCYAYQDANYGYNGYYVDRDDYNYYFREGFRRGYEDGYYSRYQYGRYANGSYTVLDAIVSQVLGFQPLR